MYETSCQRVFFAYKFTGKERDQETGLDYFGARYFGSALGRFTSPDPIGIMKQKLVDPQQWNMYVYARNSSLRFMDPTGEFVTENSWRIRDSHHNSRIRDVERRASTSVICRVNAVW
jgi:RHS repeat-associated protein